MTNKSWYQIKAMNESFHITIHGVIGDWGVSSEDFKEELKRIPEGSAITLHLHTDGGSVIEGYAIHIMLRRHSSHITTVVDGIAASMGSYLFMLGEKRIIPPNAFLMIHSPKGANFGSPEENSAFTDFLYQIKSEMVTTYSKNSNLSEDEIIEMMKVDTWIRGDKAVEMGLATELDEEIDIAAQSTISLDSFKNIPESLQALNDQNKKPNPSAVAGNKPKLEGNMPELEKNKATTTVVSKVTDNVDPQAIANDAILAAKASEQTRKNDIVEAFGDFSECHSELLHACLMDGEVTVAQAQSQLLRAMGEGISPTGSPAAIVEGGKSGSERFIEDGVEALLAKAGMGTVSSSNPLRGYRLDLLARRALEVSGVQANGMDSMQIVGAAFTQTTSDFPTLLENAMHKVLQNAYATQADTWTRFCAKGSVSDFREHNRYRLGSFGNLDGLSEAGEFKNKNIPDGEKSKISATTKGNVINLTRQSIIDDDMGVFVNFAANLGRAARRTIEADVYALLALNGGLGPALLDGKTLFHADHGNIGAGAGMSVAAIEADRVLMGKQMDIGKNDFLDLRPEVLLTALALGGTARVINDAQYDPDTANKLQRPNMVRGLFNDIVDSPRLNGTRRYMFANPLQAPVIEVAFLNGEENPFLESENGFTVDGVRWKVRMDYGVAAVDYRGAVTDAGA